MFPKLRGESVYAYLCEGEQNLKTVLDALPENCRPVEIREKTDFFYPSFLFRRTPQYKRLCGRPRPCVLQIKPNLSVSLYPPRNGRPRRYRPKFGTPYAERTFHTYVCRPVRMSPETCLSLQIPSELRKLKTEL